MKIKVYITILMAILTLPINAQLLNFSLRTNNQQLIDEALSGAFVKINQSYELCDTVTNERFGRDRKDYFNIVPYIGIETEKGLVFPKSALTPWISDKDFDKYKDKYKPLVTQSKLGVLNGKESNESRKTNSPLTGLAISKDLCTFQDSTQTNSGLKLDILSGKKNGWIIWISSASTLELTDSVKFTSIKKEINVPEDGGLLPLENPEISENVYGGVYVTPVQTSLGQITFTLTGVLVGDEDGWSLDCPFINQSEENLTLTPIPENSIGSKLKSSKKKKK